MINNIIAEVITKDTGGCFLDSNNILWKDIKGEWIGKRAIYLKSLRAVWKESIVPTDEIYVLYHGLDADYKEIFR
tara:strand:- start:5521 stop:5745 length:225 start_codon:yes stop_codon:yes gene_type:complete